MTDPEDRLRATMAIQEMMESWRIDPEILCRGHIELWACGILAGLTFILGLLLGHFL